MERIGARKTFARITILWGLTSIATMLVTSATSFYILRFCSARSKRGCSPARCCTLTYWFPARRRAQMVGLFLAAIPLAGVLGGPLSGVIMGRWAAASVWPTGNGCFWSKVSLHW